MTTVFGETYAGLYDHFYHDKDYRAECDLVMRLFDEYAQRPVREILDMGCGTGGHTHLLAERGFRVVGMDRSRHMIECARKKSQKTACIAPDFFVSDMRDFRIDRKFDAVLMMSAVFNYLLEDHDVLTALETARVHLRPGGLIMFDSWYGPAVDHQQPSPRQKSIGTKAGRVVRSSSTELDRDRNLCTVTFHVDEQNAQGGRQSDETHCVRYFYGPELKAFLEDAGFEFIRIGAMPDFDREPDPTCWNAMVVGRYGVQPKPRA